jgi:transposase-like protein
MSCKTTKIKPEHPFLDFSIGYLYVNQEGRRIVHLVGSSGRLTTSYARYRVSVIEGRRLSSDEEVDHKDDDRTNDADDNLQILSSSGNLEKQAAAQRVALVIFVCSECKTTKGLLPSVYRSRSNGGKRHVYCGRSCSSKANIRLGLSPKISDLISTALSIPEITEIRKLYKSGMSVRKIAKTLKLGRSTVSRYAKTFDD